MSGPHLDPIACRSRQQRLTQWMRAADLELVVVSQPEHVQWLAGVRFPWLVGAAAALHADGRLTLAAPRPVETAAADEVVVFDSQWRSTVRQEQRRECDAALLRALGATPKRIGCEFSSCGAEWPRRAETVDVEPPLWRLRRRKDDDEVTMIRHSIRATERMYERARELIRPGVSELEVFSELQTAAVASCGEMLTRTGNDYQCGSPGGPPRKGRRAAPGELYILDLGPAYRGYFADNCRTIAVTEADDTQLEAWRRIEQVFPLVESTVRPGVKARQLFAAAQSLLDEAPVGEFTHHLGHGIGLFPHEAPHLNPNWDDTFEEGDIFTVEPGLYAPELRGGMRIENNYRVTAEGVELLTTFGREL